eukprot:TRINITY_DN42551_c0_g2_i3.p1 TRINITY_DN42551_c0_g2~~TRINITY_DN42551_c0_g2_i3.p1  ORF type:complete len:176 (-),score=19.24 TRINITY_DN42551_c0_g2_i3:551-1078(-)
MLPADGEMQENTQVLHSVAMADADIFDAIVEDAFAFACRLLRSVARVVQTEDGDEIIDLLQAQSAQSPTHFLLTIEERMSDLQGRLSDLEAGTTDADVLLSRLARRKAWKKLKQCKRLLHALCTCMLLRILHGILTRQGSDLAEVRSVLAGRRGQQVVAAAEERYSYPCSSIRDS